MRTCGQVIPHLNADKPGLVKPTCHSAALLRVCFERQNSPRSQVAPSKGNQTTMELFKIFCDECHAGFVVTH